MVICFLISATAFAASMVGTVQRIISQPAFSRRLIWATVFSTSSVGVFVMDCIKTGLPPPITLSPIFITFVWSLYISYPFLCCFRIGSLLFLSSFAVHCARTFPDNRFILTHGSDRICHLNSLHLLKLPPSCHDAWPAAPARTHPLS